MKKIFISLIRFYQVFISQFIHTITGTSNGCRFNPTCSEYAKISIAKKGVIKGTGLSFVRLLKCQPFYKSI